MNWGYPQFGMQPTDAVSRMASKSAHNEPSKPPRLGLADGSDTCSFEGCILKGVCEHEVTVYRYTGGIPVYHLIGTHGHIIIGK
jgi:hypothetical protein